MTKDEVLALSNKELNFTAMRCLSVATEMVCGGQSPKPYSTEIAAAWELLESVYDHGGKIKGGAWVLGTVEGGRDVASACLIWKEKGFTKFRPLKVTVIRPRGEMAKAITQAWVCGMLGLSDVTLDR